jgi:hypothetical protein
VLGISGVVGGLVKGKARELPRWLFFAGLLTGGMALKTLYPAGTMRTREHTQMLAGLDTPQSIVRILSCMRMDADHARTHTHTSRPGRGRDAFVARRGGRASCRRGGDAGQWMHLGTRHLRQL